MTPEALKSALCKEFCGGLNISQVPAGLAVSSDMLLESGDPLTFYLVETDDGFACEDDGDFIASAIALGQFSDTGARSTALDNLLSDHGAYLDRDTCQLRREAVSGEMPSSAALAFLSACIRARDILLLSRERVASSFLDDLRAEIAGSLGDAFEIEKEAEVDNPADILLRDPRTGMKSALIYAAHTNEKLMAALIRHGEQREDEAPVIAVLPDLNGQVSKKVFMMAQNRSLLMPFFNPGPANVSEFVRKHAKAKAA